MHDEERRGDGDGSAVQLEIRGAKEAGDRRSSATKRDLFCESNDQEAGQELEAATEHRECSLPKEEAMEPCLSTFVFPFFLTYGRRERRWRTKGTRNKIDARRGTPRRRGRWTRSHLRGTKTGFKKRIERGREIEEAWRGRMKEEDEIETSGAKERPQDDGTKAILEIGARGMLPVGSRDREKP